VRARFASDHDKPGLSSTPEPHTSAQCIGRVDAAFSGWSSTGSAEPLTWDVRAWARHRISFIGHPDPWSIPCAASETRKGSPVGSAVDLEVSAGRTRAFTLLSLLCSVDFLRGLGDGSQPPQGGGAETSLSMANTSPWPWCQRPLASRRMSSTTCLPLQAPGRWLLARNQRATPGC